MARPQDLETLRRMFSDQRVHLAVGIIKQLHLASDRSVLQVAVSVFPENREIIARMSWESVGADSGIFEFPAPGDLVLIGFAEGDVEHAFILKRLTSKEEKVPVKATEGNLVIRAKKDAYLSGQKVHVGKSGSAATEPLVLGLVLKTFLTNLIDSLLNAPQIGQSAMGPVMLEPQIRQDLTQFKTDFLDTASTNILSQVAFTERGDS